MFSLLSGLYQWLVYKEEKKIIILGLDNAGKTTTMNQFKAIFGQKAMDLDKITPTIGFNVAKVEIDKIAATIWDLGGQTTLRTIWKNYFPEVEGILYVVDSCDRDRFLEANDELDNVLAHPDMRKCVPLLILANKQDLPQASPVEEVSKVFCSSSSEGSSRTSRPFQLLPCSALKQTNLAHGIRWLLAETRKVESLER